MKKLLALLSLAAFSVPAVAEPVSAFMALVGNEILAAIGSKLFWAKVALLVVATSYTSSVARRKARKEAAAARAKYNASLEDRAVTVLSASPPWRAVYGRCIVGGDVVAMFTTDKAGVDDKGKSYTKKDGLRHLVIRIADHPVHAIHGAFWGGTKIGPMTGIGTPTYSPGNGGIPVGQTATSGWATGWTETKTAIIRGDTKMPYKVQSLTSAIDSTGANRLGSLTLSSDSMRVTGPAGERIKLTYVAIREDFVKSGNSTKSVTFVGTTTLTVPALSIIYASYFVTSDSTTVDEFPVTATLSSGGLVITSPETTHATTVTYIQSNAQSRIRFSFHTGEAGQAVDAYLNNLIPAKWTANHILEGKAYAVVTLDLEDQRFQGGASELSFDVSGRLLWDPRTSTTVFSSNNALVANDFLTAPWGYKCDADEVNTAYLIAAANACDTSQVFKETDAEFGTVTTTTEPLYTFNGPYTTEESREGMLESIAESMAGSIVDSSEWLIIAGVWTSPVRDLEESDLAGSVEVMQGDNGIDETFNAVRGRYIPKGLTAPTDFTPYRNTTLITSDGEPLYDNVEYPYTDSNARCLNLARIHTEMSRTGLIIKYPAKTRAWGLQIGDRVRVNGTDFNFTYKNFRVTDWQHTLRAPVELILQEDEPGTYDTIDTAVADPTKNIDLANPFSVGSISNVTIESGTEHLIRNPDGTIIVRAYVSWDEPSDAYIGQGSGRVVVQYKNLSVSGTSNWETIGNDDNNVNSAYINNLRDGDTVFVRVFGVNSLGIEGPSTFVTHEVVGTTAVPSNVTGLGSSASLGIIQWVWNYPPDIDYDSTEIRSTDANWGLSTPAPLWKGKANRWPEGVSSVGSYTRYFRHVDTGGRVSAATASRTQAVVAADLTPDVSTFKLDIAPVAGVLYTDYRGVVTNFSSANATVTVKKSDGTDVTTGWTLSKVDTDISTTLTSGGALTINSFTAGSVDEKYYGSVFRGQYKDNLNDASLWRHPTIQVTPGAPVTFSATGGPFASTGYMQMQGTGGAQSGLRYGPSQVFSTGFNTNWSLSAWVLLTEYPSSGQNIVNVGTAKQLQIDGNGTTHYFYARYFGLSAAGGATSSATGQVVATGPSVANTTWPLNTWAFIEATWSASERIMRIFRNGTLIATSTAGASDLATYTEIVSSVNISQFLTAGCSGNNGANPLRNGRLADVDYTYGGSVNTASYTAPSALRSTRTAITKATTKVTAASGGSTLEATYPINTVPTAPASIQMLLSRSSGVVKTRWDNTNYDYSGATVSIQILVNGRNDTGNWDIFVTQYGATASISFSASNTTKIITVTGITEDSAPLNIVATNPLYQSQYYLYDVIRARDPKPAQTVSLTKSLITIAGDTNGVATDFSNATTQASMFEGGSAASGWSWSASVSSGITFTHSNGLVTITAMSASVDSGSITLTATKSGWTNAVVRCEVLKTKLLEATGPQATLKYVSIVAFNNTPGSTVNAKIRYRPDGTIQTFTTAGGWIAAGNWYLPTTTGIGSSYAVKFLNGSGGTNNTGVAGPISVWSTISSDIEFNAQNSGTTDGYLNSSSVTIRTTATTPVIVSQGIVNLQAEGN